MASPTLLGLLPPLAGPNLNNNNNQQSVRKCGYLRKQKHGHKRFFVLRSPGGGGEEQQPGAAGARLEYYESEKKWKSKCGAPKRVIALDSCLNINKRADAKHKYLIALYTKDEYFAVAAENEQEQEGWYRALTDLLQEGKAACQGSPLRHLASPSGAASASSPSGAGEELSYGLLAPSSAAFREVWQVTLKPKGLGQSKNLTGVHRLCLSARTIGFVRLNCELPSVTLQLMNIRRCGHSDSFFFMEVGRSAATGPGELWMQADDSVVAQNIHETILEAMKALKELAEFRPRSKSQSSSSSSSSSGGASATHPITVPGRRHHHHHHHLVNLPPSHTGLLRRSRPDGLAAGAKGSPGRARTASEGDGCRAGSLAGSPMSPGPVRAPLSRSHTLGGGRPGGKPGPLPPGGGLPSSRSMSMPVSHSPPSAASPLSLSEAPPPQRPSSGSASASGSPSDPGFMSFDEYGSSPGGDARPFSSSSAASNRSNTPDSAADTPPARGAALDGYMAMARPGAEPPADKGPRKRTYSLTTPCRQRAAPPQLSSASLDEYTLMRAACAGRLFPPCPAAASPKVTYTPYPEDYGDVEIGSGSSSRSNLAPPAGGGGDDGYMPMSPGVAAAAAGRGGDDYVPMSPTSVSAPKQILRPRPGGGCSPADSSPDDSGYMPMWGGCRLSGDSSDCPPPAAASLTPPDFFFHAPKAAAGQEPARDSDQYVFMNSPGRLLPAAAAPSGPHPLRPESSPGQRGGRPVRPSRLPLDAPLPSTPELPLPPEPHSPGEYINIDFGADSPACSDYINLDFGPRPSPSPDSCPGGGRYLQAAVGVAGPPDGADYTEMSFGVAATAADGARVTSPTGGVKRLTLAGVEAFILASPPPDPDRGAKVIRADPQGRRRHSSETFSSTTTVTPVSPSFAHNPKRHNSASVENVSLRKSEGLEEEQGSPMCRETSAGFQNGLNYIAIDVLDGGRARHGLNGDSSAVEPSAYASIGFLSRNLKEATAVKE